MTRRKVRIAIVSDAVFPFNKGGKETRILHLTTALKKMDQDIHIYTMNWWHGKKTYTIDGTTYHALSRYYPLYHGNRRSIKEGLWFGVACLKLIFENFDVLEVDHMPFFPLYSAKIVSLLKRKPLFATWHEVWGKAYWQEYLGGVQGLIAYFIEKLSVHLPDHIVAVSAHTETQLRTVLGYKGPIKVISNGIEYQRISDVKPSTVSSDVIFAGRLLAHKNVHLLVEAMAELTTLQPTIRCLIIGDGPERGRIAKLITEYGLEDNVTMLGLLELPEDVFAHLKASKVFVLPSVREGFGIVVLEAMVCGLSVVTVKSRDNAAQYLVPPTMGIVCEPTAPDLARAIASLLKTSAHNPSHVLAPADYDWSRSAEALTEVYGL